MKLTPQETQELVATYRSIREQMTPDAQASAEIVARMYGISEKQVLALAFFEGAPQPPRPSRAGVVEIRRRQIA
jgi:hypothetical protein